jgi:hypothetical protein
MAKGGGDDGSAGDVGSCDGIALLLCFPDVSADRKLRACLPAVERTFGSDQYSHESSVTKLQVCPLFSITSTIPLPQPFSFPAFALLPGGGYPLGLQD